MILGAGHLYLALLAKCTTRNGTISLTRQIAALELLLSAAPGFVNAHVMLARTHMELGDLEVSQESLQTAISLDSTCACAYILLAQIELERMNIDLSQSYLKQASTVDSSVRESLKFLALQANLHILTGEFGHALSVLESAIILPCMNKDSEKLEYYSTQGKMLMDESSANKVMLYFLLAKVQIKMQNFAEAEKTIDDASRLFSGLHEKALMEVARAVLFVAKGKIDLGIEILHHIPCDSHCLIEARTAMAHIYLEHKGDKMRFLQCFSELAELFPSAKMHLKLADAFNKVNDPIRAIKSLESALKNSPNDASIIKKFGNALITCHEYQRAKALYVKSLGRNLRDSCYRYVQYDLAELYFILKDFLKAEQLTRDAIAKMEHSPPSKTLLMFLSLSMKIQSSQGRYSPASEADNHCQARKLPGRLLFGVCKGDNTLCCKTCVKYGLQVCQENNDLDSAILFLSETLNDCPAHTSALLLLSNIHLVRGELSECEVNCANLLKVDMTSSDGGKLLILVLLQREMYDAALSSMQQLLQRDPTCYIVLEQIIELLRRLGRVEDSSYYIVQAEKSSKRDVDAGLYYCKGFYAQHMNEAMHAVELFNYARSDAKWGKRALLAMIEIYSHIDDELFYDEENLEFTVPYVKMEDVSKVQQLLSEFRQEHGTVVAWECFGLMYSGQKGDAEAALVKINKAAAREKDHVLLMLCRAVALMILKQTGKAKAELRSIDRLTYKWNEGINFERAWLMLAQTYLQQAGKLDVAEQLCRKCISYNRSSSKAWEFLGVAMERGNAYTEAANFYQCAWKHQRGSSLTVGYKLARVYLKLKRYMDAIAICQAVMQLFPNSIKIRRDVLDKARKCIRF
ncbi:hypothetical protein SELMODRAFT_138415 [Selaginella moellendorffii]|uniref:Tetratricopeptide repeat protein 21B n=1 Tax=Selaginella moellendorffii TaxID=88036 RepID=D8TFA1_SELML|nr:hypothetical protein SELMODRAFT_138415 [Selaginella moellendorffii]